MKRQDVKFQLRPEALKTVSDLISLSKSMVQESTPSCLYILTLVGADSPQQVPSTYNFAFQSQLPEAIPKDGSLYLSIPFTRRPLEHLSHDPSQCVATFPSHLSHLYSSVALGANLHCSRSVPWWLQEYWIVKIAHILDTRGLVLERYILLSSTKAGSLVEWRYVLFLEVLRVQDGIREIWTSIHAS